MRLAEGRNPGSNRRCFSDLLADIGNDADGYQAIGKRFLLSYLPNRVSGGKGREAL